MKFEKGMKTLFNHPIFLGRDWKITAIKYHQVVSCAWVLRQTLLVLPSLIFSFATGDLDILLMKFDNAGVHQWTVLHGGPRSDEARALQAPDWQRWPRCPKGMHVEWENEWENDVWQLDFPGFFPDTAIWKLRTHISYDFSEDVCDFPSAWSTTWDPSTYRAMLIQHWSRSVASHTIAARKNMLTLSTWVAFRFEFPPGVVFPFQEMVRVG